MSVDKLRELYSGVIFAYGATSERKLGLPNEETIKGVLSSRRIVNWYNGSLDYDLDYEQDLNLENIRDVAIIGNGNVAMDITRVLVKDPASMNHFDAPSSVMEKLRKSTVKNVQVIGRRGIV